MAARYHSQICIRVIMTAENIDVAIPTASVTAKPRTGPVPRKYRMAAAIKVVRLESKIVAKAF